jgi:hypothetical protein
MEATTSRQETIDSDEVTVNYVRLYSLD